MKENVLTDIEIRQEIANDYPAVYNIHTNAFGRKAEACLTDRLRLSDVFIPELSLVAVSQNKVIGHILFTKAKIENLGEEVETLILAPISINPDHQKKGIGSRLIKEGIEIARRLEFCSIIVLGDANYYPRFGFKPTFNWNIKAPFNVPPKAFMALEIYENSLSGIKGVVRLSEEFLQI